MGHTHILACFHKPTSETQLRERRAHLEQAGLAPSGGVGGGAAVARWCGGAKSTGFAGHRGFAAAFRRRAADARALSGHGGVVVGSTLERFAVTAQSPGSLALPPRARRPALRSRPISPSQRSAVCNTGRASAAVAVVGARRSERRARRAWWARGAFKSRVRCPLPWTLLSPLLRRGSWQRNVAHVTVGNDFRIASFRHGFVGRRGRLAPPACRQLPHRANVVRGRRQGLGAVLRDRAATKPLPEPD
mmetsp:Transcript_68001/g.189918  ORF Transcript_68001/g.189918 Transcript_68001/m.189918 type:complete len:247 (-) Transcript_68001:8-748(-)